MGLIEIIITSLLHRIAEEEKLEMSKILDNMVEDENSHFYKLRAVWDPHSSKIQGEILGKLTSYWNRLARRGRTLEEVARSISNLIILCLTKLCSLTEPLVILIWRS